MTLTTGNGSVLFGPDQINELFIEPLIATAVATDPAVSTVVTLTASRWRAPKVTADPSAAWVNEGAEIPVTDAELDEVEVIPRKLAGLTIVSSELLEDADEDAADVVGDGLVRDSAKKLDAAFTGNLALPAPPGLGSLTGHQTVIGGELNDLEAFARAVGAAEDVGATTTAFLANSFTLLRLADLREGEGSNRPLLATDPAQPTRRIAEGRPILPAPSLPNNVVYAVDASRNFTILRTSDAEVVSDQSAFFTSDRVAIRSRLRAGFGFVHEESVVRIEFSA